LIPFRRRFDVVGLSGLCAFLLWRLRHVFAPGPLLGWDSVGHLLKVEHVRRVLLPAFAIDGWFPYWHCGFQLFQLYPPAFYWITAVVACATGPVVALKLTTLASFLALPPAVYWMLRELGIRRAGALAAALASAFVSCNSGGIPGTFLVGLLPGTLGLALIPAVVAACHRAQRLRTPGAVRLAGAALALILLSHAYSAYFALLAVGLDSLASLTTRRLRHTLEVGARVVGWTLGLAAFWLGPMLTKYAYRGPAGDWTVEGGLLEQLVNQARGGFVTDGFFTSLGWAGLVIAFVVGRAGYRFLAALSLAALALAIGLVNRQLPFAEVVGGDRMVRFEPALGVAWAALAGIAVAEALALADRWPTHRQALRLAVGGALGLGVLLVSMPAQSQAIQACVRVESDFPALGNVRTAALWMRDHLPAEARVLGEIDWADVDTLGTPHVLNQYVPLLAGRMQLGGNFGEGSPVSGPTRTLPETLSDPASDFERQLHHYGTGYVATLSHGATIAMRRRLGWDWVYRSSLVNVFAMRNPATLLELPAGSVLQDLASGNAGMAARIRTDGPQALSVALTYSPNWRATLDGASLPLRAEAGLIALDVPSGGEHDFRLRYAWSGWERCCRALSAIVALAALVSCFGSARPHMRPPDRQ
jgi:hypothetical protein